MMDIDSVQLVEMKKNQQWVKVDYIYCLSVYDNTILEPDWSLNMLCQLSGPMWMILT